MPELAEVHWFARRWAPALGGVVAGTLLDADARVFRECDTATLAAALPGRAFTGLETSGKQAIFRFGDDLVLGVHLGMTGRLFLESRRDEQPAWASDEVGDAPRRPPNRKHDLLTLVMRDGDALVFNDYRRFGKILAHTGPGEPAWWRDRAPDILSPDFGDDRLVDSLRRHPRSALKALLLDQAYFPGVGNWMADEILWRAGIAPSRPAGDLSRAESARLLAALRDVCTDALRVVGEGWGAPPNDWLFNHRWKKGGVCPATGVPLRYDTVGGRTSCWSPAKQK